MRICSTCNTEKDLSLFIKRIGRCDGHTHTCKTCHAEKTKLWRQKNKEKSSAISKKSKLKHAAKRRRERHEYYIKNRDKTKIQVKKWQTENKAKFRNIGNIAKAKRRRKMAESKNRLTVSEWEKIKTAADHRCFYCKRKKKLTMDHVIPLAKGGNNDSTNIVPACLDCNQKKGTKILTLL